MMNTTRLDVKSRRWLLGLACGISLYGNAGAAPFDTWFPVNSGTTKLLLSVAYGGGTFVAVGREGTILVSSNGLAWTDRTFVPTNNYADVAYGDGVFVAVQTIPGLIGRSGGIVRSEDGGQTWEALNLNRPWSGRGVTYGFGQFVAVGDPTESGPSPELVLVSSDGGRTWTGRSLESTGGFNDVTFSVREATFVALEDPDEVWISAFSSDASDWTQEFSLPGRHLACAYGGTNFVAVGHDDMNSKGIIRFSGDGRTWIDSKDFGGVSSIERLQGVGYGEGTFVATGESGILAISTNGTNWRRLRSFTDLILRDAAYGQGTFVVVGDAGTILAAFETDTLFVVAPERVTLTYGDTVRDAIYPREQVRHLYQQNVPGIWSAIAPPAATVLNVGSNHPVSVQFRPDDASRFSPTNLTVLVDVWPAPLTITAINQFRQKGQPNPMLIARYSEFRRLETEADLDTPVILTTTADLNSDNGAYPIMASGAADANYTITHVDGTLFVGLAPVSLEINPTNITVDPFGSVPLHFEFAAAGTDTSGAVLDLTGLVTWTATSDPYLLNGGNGQFTLLTTLNGIPFKEANEDRIYEVTASLGSLSATGMVTTIKFTNYCAFDLFSSSDPGTEGGGPLQAAGAGADPDDVLTRDDMNLLYAVRELMRQTAPGTEWEHLYYEHTGEVVALALTNETLRTQMRELLLELLPGLSALLIGRGSEVLISQDQIDQLNGICDHFAAVGSEELATAVNTARAQFHRLQDFADQPFDQWGQVLGLAAPISILRSAVVNGQFQLEAKAVPGLNYTLLRSGDLTPASWAPVTGLVTVTNGFRVTLTDPAPPAGQSFYRLEAIATGGDAVVR